MENESYIRVLERDGRRYRELSAGELLAMSEGTERQRAHFNDRNIVTIDGDFFLDEGPVPKLGKRT